MPKRKISSARRVLLVEDNPADAELTAELLAEATPGCFELTVAETLTEAKAILGQDFYDVVLLDLGLPDSQGMNTLDAVLKVAPEVAVVILSGHHDEALGAEAVRRGAQDYLTKGLQDGSRLFARSLIYAIERRGLLRRLEEAELEATRAREVQALSRLTPEASAPVTASMFGAGPLADTQPEAFAELSGEYGRLVERAAERQVYKVERRINAPLEQLATRLGFLRAGPRDVVELHKRTLATLTLGAGQATERLLTEEGRYLLLELMGQLVAYYRRFYSGPKASTRS